MAEQLPPLDSALKHEITKSRSPMYATVVNSSKVASCSNSNDMVPLPLNSASSFSVPLPMPPVDFVNERTNVFQFTAKVIKNSDEAKRQKRKQANLKSARQSRKRRQDLMKNIEIEVEHLKKITSELSLACSKCKENCDTSHCWNRVAIVNRVTIIARVYTSEKQLMRVTRFHPLDDPVFISIAENAGWNLSDVRSLIHAPTYLTSQIPPYLNQLVSTFSNAPHPQEQQVQNQNFLNIGLHGAMPGWDNNQQKKY